MARFIAGGKRLFSVAGRWDLSLKAVPGDRRPVFAGV